MRTTRTAALLAALLGLLALAPAASGQSALDQYQQTGRINPCTLTGGAGDIPNDVAQYAPDFLDAYRAAQRAGCQRPDVSTTRPTETDEGVPVDSGGQALPPGTTYVPKPPAPPKFGASSKSRTVRHQPLAVKSDTTTPLPVIALGVMLLLALIGAAVTATWRYMGWGLDRLDPARHAAGETRLRLAELGDRLRALARRGA